MNSKLRVHHGLVSSVRLPSILLIMLMLHSAAISLPLVRSDHGAILHVSVQLLTAKTGFREFKQQRDKGLQSGNNVDKETEPNMPDHRLLNWKCLMIGR
ncbi:hypothetical protein Tco_0168957 [Tanacetum coccineum]